MDVIRPEGHKCDDNDSMSSTAMNKPTDKENKSDKMEVDEDDEDDDILQETEAIKPKTKTVKRMKCLLCCLFRDIANKNSARMAKVCAMAYEDGQVHDNRRIDKHFHPKEGVSHIAVIEEIVNLMNGSKQKDLIESNPLLAMKQMELR
eukprot:390869_1